MASSEKTEFSLLVTERFLFAVQILISLVWQKNSIRRLTGEIYRKICFQHADSSNERDI
jgi:hypothetical protein